MKDISHLRRSYLKNEEGINPDINNPFELFDIWFNHALETKAIEPNAFTLSTINQSNKPTSRIVLLKKYGEKSGFVFYTNYLSSKGQNIEYNPHVSMLFFWKELEQQIRIEGRAQKIDDDQSKKYFSSRPRGSQIGAWASAQSSILVNREALKENVDKVEKKYEDLDILPKPPYWGGYSISPTKFEFWQGKNNRLHDRLIL